MSKLTDLKIEEFERKYRDQSIMRTIVPKSEYQLLITWLQDTLSQVEREVLENLKKEYEDIQEDLDIIYDGNIQPNYMGILEKKIDELKEAK